MQLEVIDYQFG